MISVQAQAQIDAFLDELVVFYNQSPDKNKLDARPIYEKYPLVRIGLRRALLKLRQDGRIE